MKTLALALSLVCFASGASAETYIVTGAGTNDDTIKFSSQAKLEFIQGTTNDISGYVRFNPAQTSDSVAAKLQVDLRTLKTGIDLRDEHMRTRHLQTDKFPLAWFELTAVKGLPDKLIAGVSYSCSAEGYFYIHGVKRKIAPTVEIVDNSAGSNRSISVRAHFIMNLDEWKIPRPKALFLRLAETINIDVVFTGESGKAAPAVSLPGWPEI